MTYGGAYLPILQLPRTHSVTTSHHPRSTDGRAGSDRTCDRNADAVLRTIFRAVCSDGDGVRRGPRATTSFGPQHELRTQARLVIHRQTSAHERRKGTREGSI